MSKQAKINKRKKNRVLTRTCGLLTARNALKPFVTHFKTNGKVY